MKKTIFKTTIFALLGVIAAMYGVNVCLAVGAAADGEKPTDEKPSDENPSEENPSNEQPSDSENKETPLDGAFGRVDEPSIYERGGFTREKN